MGWPAGRGRTQDPTKFLAKLKGCVSLFLITQRHEVIPCGQEDTRLGGGPKDGPGRNIFEREAIVWMSWDRAFGGASDGFRRTPKPPTSDSFRKPLDTINRRSSVMESPLTSHPKEPLPDHLKNSFFRETSWQGGRWLERGGAAPAQGAAKGPQQPQEGNKAKTQVPTATEKAQHIDNAGGGEGGGRAIAAPRASITWRRCSKRGDHRIAPNSRLRGHGATIKARTTTDRVFVKNTDPTPTAPQPAGGGGGGRAGLHRTAAPLRANTVVTKYKPNQDRFAAYSE